MSVTFFNARRRAAALKAQQEADKAKAEVETVLPEAPEEVSDQESVNEPEALKEAPEEAPEEGKKTRKKA